METTTIKTNLFEKAFNADLWFKENLKENGYECFTTFYSDITIAELMGGKDAIKETIDSVMEEWITNINYITEFCMAFNWKSWEMYERIKKESDKDKKSFYSDLCMFYCEQYYDVRDKILSHYEKDKEALTYFFNTTD